MQITTDSDNGSLPQEDQGIEPLPLTGERFGFTLFVSICVHVMLILGVGFSYLEKIEAKPSLEVTLAQYRSIDAPEEADFLAQQNQDGGGNLDEKAAPSTPIQSRFNDDQIQDVSPFQQNQATPLQETTYRDEILTVSVAETLINTDDEEIEPEEEPSEEQENLDPTDLEQSIASLQAQLDLHREAFAKRPRKHTISSASTQEARDALYLDGWRKKIEAIGNINYPQQATTEGIYGTLRLLVAIRQDGSVEEIRVLSSSGYNVLDDAAIRIVRLASPFEAFPAGMREDIDILEIIRTWQFHQSNSLTSY